MSLYSATPRPKESPNRVSGALQARALDRLRAAPLSAELLALELGLERPEVMLVLERLLSSDLAHPTTDGVWAAGAAVLSSSAPIDHDLRPEHLPTEEPMPTAPEADPGSQRAALQRQIGDLTRQLDHALEARVDVLSGGIDGLRCGLEARLDRLEVRLQILADAGCGPDLADRVAALERGRVAPAPPPAPAPPSERAEIAALLEQLAGGYSGPARVALLEAAIRVEAGERAGGGR